MAERKTGKVRAITLKKALSAAKMLTGDPSNYVFKSQKGDNKPFSTTQAYRILNVAAERAGLTDKIGAIGTHTLRKTFGYWL
ncbi:tyrosine-type recombinase/integrase [Alkalicoccobacillus gibsonii]|uniref:tyrosine-type recombinase/integrase n=1 Tax=Alkalicoccobacillus gibsonii TaxID=79881 RepID=UPI003F7B5DA3